MLYSKNQFRASASHLFPPRCPASLLVFSDKIGATNAARIQSICIYDLSDLSQSFPGDILETEDYPNVSKTIRYCLPSLSTLRVHHCDFHYLLTPGSHEQPDAIPCTCLLGYSENWLGFKAKLSYYCLLSLCITLHMSLPWLRFVEE